jgi:hypothetical protein
MEKNSLSRRSVIRIGVAGIAAAALSRLTPGVAAERVQEGEGLAATLRYRHDANTADGRGDSNAFCKNCSFFQGGDAAWGGCTIFGGNEVNASGWCQSYRARG